MSSRFLMAYRQFGAIAGTLYLMDRALSSITPQLRLFVYELMVQPIPAEPILKVRDGRALDVRMIQQSHSALSLMPLPTSTIESRYGQGATCLGAFREDQLVAYMWYCNSRYDEDEVRCTYALTPDAESVFDYDFYIFPAYRLSRAFASLWNGAIEHLHRRGIRYTFSRLTRFNLASRSAHSHLGWKRVGSAVFLKIWQFQCMVATVSPFISLTLTGRPRLDLRAHEPRA